MQPCLQSSRRALLRASDSRRVIAITSLLSSSSNAPQAPSQRRRRGFATAVPAAELQFGQPLHETHPHLLKAGELTPGISAAEYDERRTRLAAQLPPGSVAILPAAETKFRSGSVFYDFHQECNFFYLTGFNEPDALAVIHKDTTHTGGEHTFHLLVRPKDAKAEMWEGSRSGLAAATDVFNADGTGDIGQVGKGLRPLLDAAAEVYTDAVAGKGGSMLSRLLPPAAAPQGELPRLLADRKTKPLGPLVHGLRMHKSAAELAVLRRAGALSGAAFGHAMRRAWRGERALADFLEHRFRQLGCDKSAYVPVVAGGANALTIHYVRNDAAIDPAALVLVDAGGELGHYVADITRTFPAGPRFSPAQRDLYAVVLAAQRTCVALCRADARLSLDKLHQVAEDALRQGLVALGFDLGRDGLDLLFPHHLGHYLGLDVHDCPGASRRDPLVEGQCVTVEPGVYVPDHPRWPAAFRGLGVRIEDSVAVGSDRPLVLTAEAAKGVAEIEELRAEQIEIEAAHALR